MLQMNKKEQKVKNVFFLKTIVFKVMKPISYKKTVSFIRQKEGLKKVLNYQEFV